MNMIKFCSRKSLLVKNNSENAKVVINHNHEDDESVDVVLLIWNILMSWLFGDNDEAASEEIETVEETVTIANAAELINIEDEDFNILNLFQEEQHLELFYIVSFLFLTFLIINITKKNVELSRRRASIIESLKKMKVDKNGETGVMRQISFH